MLRSALGTSAILKAFACMPYEKVAKYSKLTLEEVKALDAKKPA